MAEKIIYYGGRKITERRGAGAVERGGLENR